MIHDTPKPTKKTTSVTDRVLKNPFTTIVGLLLIAGSFWGLHKGLDVTYCSGIGFAGLIAMGIKDPRK